MHVEKDLCVPFDDTSQPKLPRENVNLSPPHTRSIAPGSTDQSLVDRLYYPCGSVMAALTCSARRIRFATLLGTCVAGAYLFVITDPAGGQAGVRESLMPRHQHTLCVTPEVQEEHDCVDDGGGGSTELIVAEECTGI
jgi:hypothetical protein